MQHLVFKAFLISLCILLLDILSKALIVQWIPWETPPLPWYPYGGIGIFENIGGIEFSIVRLSNTGAAWGMFTQWQEYLLALRLILIGGMILYLLFYNKTSYTIIPLSMIIAGAMGNVLDMFIYGYVVDMIHFVFWGYDFPAFNIADSAICLGVTGLFITSFLPVPSLKNPI